MRIGIIGGGGWGTALTVVLASRGHDLILWVYEPEEAERMRLTRENSTFLPGIPIPSSVTITNAVAEAVAGSEGLILVTPSQSLRGTVERVLHEAPRALEGARFVAIASKGLERGTLLRMSEVVAQVLPQSMGPRIGVLAGPSHAEEVARRIPTAVVAAASDPSVAERIQAACSSEWFRIYTNDDVVGVEIAVALKNVVAIAAGISDGLGFGDSTKGALLTRGLVEIARLGAKLGARSETFAGLAGMGDLIATATSQHSRNRRLGEAIGRGATLEQALAGSKMVTEGVFTAHAAVDLARRHEVELPIAEQVRAILYEGKSPQTAIRELLTRDLKAEPQAFSRR